MNVTDNSVGEVIAKMQKTIDDGLISSSQMDNLCTELKLLLLRLNPNFQCRSVTINSCKDKQFFGIIVYPNINPDVLISKVFDPNDTNPHFTAYDIEIDSRVFYKMETKAIGINLSTEIERLSEYNISDVLCVIEALDPRYCKVSITENSELFALVVCTFIRDKISMWCNKDQLPVEDINYPGLLLQWFMSIYKGDYRAAIVCTLEKSLKIEGSKILKNKTVSILRKMNTYSPDEERYLLSLTEAANKKKHGLVAKLKLDGLRSIEEDLYEFTMRLRNVSDQDGAILLMRQINSRMSIIEDYLYNNEDSMEDRDRERWEKVYQEYVNIRNELSKKTVYDRKMYGLFVDYNALQDMNNKGQLNTYY